MTQDSNPVDRQPKTFEDITKYLKELKPEKVRISGDCRISYRYPQWYVYDLTYLTIDPKNNESIALEYHFSKEIGNVTWLLFNHEILKRLSAQIKEFESQGSSIVGRLGLRDNYNKSNSDPEKHFKFNSSSELEKLAQEYFEKF